MDNPLARMMMQKKPKEVKEKVVEKKNQPWIEKYRPKKIDDVVYQEEIVLVLKKSLSNTANDFPNLLFYGPPGTGKTSTILALAHELFGDTFSQRVLELNASDERGINVVREKIKKFAKQTIAVSNNKPQFKLIILDEADSMTDSAQSALRRIMELESKNTRFCLICNYITRIIEPIASRCAKFRFNTLDQDCVIDKLQSISDLEGIQIENRDVLVELCNLSGGDLRKAINILQTALKMKKNEEKVTIDDLHEICGHIPPKIIKNIIDVCKEKSFQKLEKEVKNLIFEGYSAHQLLLQLNDWIEDENCYLNDKKKSILAEKISKADQHLLEGSNEFLQTLNVCSSLISLS